MDILKKIPFDSNQAVVFDIDDTLLRSDTFQVIKPTWELFQYCKDKGYKIYIITARPHTKKVIQWTAQQLQQAGLTGFKKISFRPQWDFNVYKYKLDMRRSIPEKIVMSVGDMVWDIKPEGGFPLLVKKYHVKQ